MNPTGFEPAINGLFRLRFKNISIYETNPLRDLPIVIHDPLIIYKNFIFVLSNKLKFLSFIICYQHRPVRGAIYISDRGYRREVPSFFISIPIISRSGKPISSLMSGAPFTKHT